MSRPIPGREAYNSPKEGYKKHSIYIRITLLERVRKTATKEHKSLTKLIEEALEKRIANDD